MPADQSSSEYLGSFAVANGVFDLGGKVTPGSIRDQIVRSRLFTRHLRDHGFLRGDKKVCVIGAGPAGMTVATQLSYIQNLRVWLVDRSPEPLSLLAKAARRLISPTLYDWPAAHFRRTGYEGAFPAYREGPPDMVREEWLYEF